MSEIPKYKKADRELILKAVPKGKENAVVTMEISQRTGINSKAIGTIVKWYLTPYIERFRKNGITYYYTKTGVGEFE